MINFVAAFQWLADPAHWVGPDGIPTRTWEQIWYSGLTLLIAAVIAIPIGLAIGHTGKGRGIAVSISGALRAIPTLGLVVFLALELGGLDITSPLIALTILAIPPVLAGAYAGVDAVDKGTVDAARAMGMTELQVLRKVELPLALHRQGHERHLVLVVHVHQPLPLRVRLGLHHGEEALVDGAQDRIRRTMFPGTQQ